MSIITLRHGDTPCPYPHGEHGDTPCPYPHGDMETLHVHIHMETWRHSTWRHKETWRHSMSISMERWRHMETWRHSISISTWRHADTPCPYPHGDMETLHMETQGDMQTLHVHITWKHGDTWRHGDTQCPYPHGDMETLHVHNHIETWRHSMSILC